MSWLFIISTNDPETVFNATAEPSGMTELDHVANATFTIHVSWEDLTSSGATGDRTLSTDTGSSSSRYSMLQSIEGSFSGGSERSKMWRLILGSYPGLGN